MSREHYLLFKSWDTVPDNAGVLLRQLALATGLDIVDLRLKLRGSGSGVLLLDRHKEELERLASIMRDHGTPAVVVPHARIIQAPDPTVARSFTIDEYAVTLLDEAGHILAKVDESTKLLIILADLSGNIAEHALAGIAYGRTMGKTRFREMLAKVAHYRPVADIFVLNADPCVGVRIQAGSISYAGLGEEMAPSGARNFENLITKLMKYSHSYIADHCFGSTSLPGAKPEKASYEAHGGAALEALNRYDQYLLAGAEAGFYRPMASASRANADEHIPAVKEDDEQTAHVGAQRGPPPPPKVTGMWWRLVRHLPLLLFLFILANGPFWILMSYSPDHQATVMGVGMTIGIALLVAGLAAFLHGLVLLNRRRTMENIPTSTIRSLSMGMVEIAGRAKQYYELRAPHSQTPCIFYRSRVYTREYTQSGQRWAEVDETTSGWLPFYVEDNTDRVLVEPEGAVIRIPLRHQSFSSRSMPFFQSNLKNVDTRTIEELLPPGAPVYVVGYAHPVRRDESIRDRLTQRLRLLKKDPVKMARYDDDGDSHIDAQEWDVARADVEREVMAEVLAREHTDAEEIVIGKPPRGRFIIADSEEELLERTAKDQWIYIVGGVAALGCGIWLLALLP